MIVFDQPSELLACAPLELGLSRVLELDQDRIDTFADVTDDHQWIHVDRERARQGPFGTTIAHGFLSLALAPRVVEDLMTVRGATMTVNYGLNKVRFPAPAPAGTCIYGRAELVEAIEIPGGVQAVIRVSMEPVLDDARSAAAHPKPVCVADLVARFYI